MRVPFALLMAFCWATTALAQQPEPLRFRISQSIPVTTPAGQLASPWSGGLNAPQFSTIDLNQDGQEDLFAFDRQLQKVFTWLAVQEAGQWKYAYAPEYEALFPDDLSDWVLLRDYNCDGLKDIFTSSLLGIRVFEQKEDIAFALVTEGIHYGSRNANIQMNSADVPAITDTDNDGDLDILVTNFSQGTKLELYRNMQAEQEEACGTLTFKLQTDWWGGITECEGCNDYKFGEACSSNEGHSVASPMHSGHAGSSLLLLDLDGDGDKELVSGSVSCPNLVLMENKGNETDALMTDVNPLFPETKPAVLNMFPAAYYEDVTFDGVPDLLVTSQVSQETHNMDFQQSVWVYQNKGTENRPAFDFVQGDFLQNQMIDLGEGAYPAFADWDNDGDLDMLVGNDGSLRDGVYGGSLSLYSNTGTASEPAFTLVTDNYLQLHDQQVYHIKPTFADLNGDGATDLVLTLSGVQPGSSRIVWLQNLAAKGQPLSYDMAYLQVLQRVAEGDAPAFTDLDGDGDLDLLLGKAASNLEFYRNTGTATAPAYTLENTEFGGIGYDFERRYLHPFVYDVDGDGAPDLLTVDESGELRSYRNIIKSQNAGLDAETEVLENELTAQVQATRLGNGLSITAAPLEGDNTLYLALGSRGGGLYLLQQTAGNAAGPGENARLALQVYPNPHDQALAEPVKVQASEPVQLDVYSIVGQRVYRTQRGKYSRSHAVPTQELQAGIYIIRASSERGASAAVKLMVR
ncbi:T9SS type A sorting domain-containing protein [Pontibacter mangrovi]|uniref:T9SS type A sorting domain-containing protein n=1 Tax=Pontibacter mangrovi TaxID=2589816 RepID=A0A501W5W9_9BACT|nr:T9SS type A sorting domain-containing protein [Pontibacter mangrovi]TPE45293.1 T9SS type A sorting domain-containing protein [Pontibacter mangrovi]